MNQHIEITHEPGRHLAVTSFQWSHEDIAERMAAAFSTVLAHLARTGVHVTGPAIGHYAKNPDGFTVSAGFVVDEVIEGDDTVRSMTLPPGNAITTLHVGPYDRLLEAYDALQDYAAENHLAIDQHVMWEEYLSEPDADPELVMTRVTWPAAHVNLVGSATM